MYNAILWTRFPEFFQKGFLSLVFSRSNVVEKKKKKFVLKEHASLLMLGQNMNLQALVILNLSEHV